MLVYTKCLKKYVIVEQSYDNIKLIMQDAYYEHALNHPTNIAEQIDVINHKILINMYRNYMADMLDIYKKNKFLDDMAKKFRI